MQHRGQRSASEWRRRAREHAKAEKATGRTATIAKLIERAVAETGLVPSDETLAQTLACSVERVRRHRLLLGI